MSRCMIRTFWIVLAMSLLPMVAIAHSQEIERKLVAAAKDGRLEEVRQLVTGDVDLKKSSSLNAAVGGGHLDVVKFLIEKGADPNRLLGQSGFKMPPLFAAAKEGHPEMLEYVISHGADLNYEGQNDTSVISTPLISAVYYGDLDTARLLVEYGADVNYVSRRGNTALFQATLFSGGDGEIDKSAEFVELLLSHGADPDIPNWSGITARQNAKFSQHPELSAFIEKAKPAPSGTVLLSASELQALTMVLLTKETCDQKLSGFREKSAPSHQAWRSKYAPLIAQIEKSPGFREDLAQVKNSADMSSVERTPAMVKHDSSVIEEMCEDGGFNS